MSQHDMEILTADANTGVTFRAAVNAALQALSTCQSGPTAPSPTYAYQFWADTTTGYLKQRNAANSAWVTLFKLADMTIDSLPAGSSASPSLSTTGDTNTGVFFPAADTIAVSTGGTERMRVSSAGNISIQSTNASGLTVSNMSVNSSSSTGNTDIGLGDSSTGITTIRREKYATNTAYTKLYSEYGNNVAVLGITINNSACYQGNNSTTWSQTSDERIKTNIREILNPLDKILSLKPKHFEYKDKIGKTKTGFIAQDFEKVFPGHINTLAPPPEYEKYIIDGAMKCIDADLIPYLVAAIQELSAKNDALEARLAALESK